jgi:hypothetical protein
MSRSGVRTVVEGFRGATAADDRGNVHRCRSLSTIIPWLADIQPVIGYPLRKGLIAWRALRNFPEGALWPLAAIGLMNYWIVG